MANDTQVVYVVVGTAHTAAGTIVTVHAACESQDRANSFAQSLKALHPQSVFAVDALPLIEG